MDDSIEAPARALKASLPADILKRLAISESGFIFDPATGDSFTANPSALAIIRLAQTEHSAERIATRLASEFDVSVEQAEREVVEFVSVLRQALG